MARRPGLSACCGPQALVAILALILLLAGSSNGYDGVGVIKLRNTTLTINSSATEPLPQDAAALTALQFSTAQGGSGLYERAEYASAYVSNDTLQLVDGVNPLDSFATVEANNSYILVNSSTPPFQSLELDLIENNTLEVNQAELYLNRSTLRLVKQNWLSVVNNSLLDLNASRMNYTDWFTWWLQGSRFSADYSILNLANVLTYWSAATVNVVDATLDFTSASPQAPARYEGKIAPVLFVEQSTVNISGTSLTFQDMPLVLFNLTDLAFTNTTVVLRNTTAHFYGDVIHLNTTQIYAENSTIGWFGNTTTTGPVATVKVLSGNLTTPNAGDALVGKPLGAVNSELSGADVDIQF